MKFKCPKCKKTFYRDGRTKPIKGKKSIVSYCEQTEQDVRCKVDIGIPLFKPNMAFGIDKESK